MLKGYARTKDIQSGILVLLAGLSADCGTYQCQNPELKNVRRFLDQSRYDSPMSAPMLQQLVSELRLKFDQQSRKFAFTDQYSRLLLEWLHPSGNSIGESQTTDSDSLDGSFQLVEKDRLQQLRQKFEAIVFDPVDTDKIEINNYMSSMFPVEDDGASGAFRELREAVMNFSDEFLGRKTAFDLPVFR